MPALEQPPVHMVRFCDQPFPCPFSALFRRHTEKELDRMAATARAVGIQRPIRLYTDTTLNLENAVLDGEGRLTVAARLGLPFDRVPFERLGEMTNDAAFALACVENDARRQDAVSEIERRERERDERHAFAHLVHRLHVVEGLSIRLVAERVGKSKAVVERALAHARTVVPGGDNRPETVTGRDGKTFAGTKPKPAVPAGPPPASPPSPTYGREAAPARLERPAVPKGSGKVRFDWGPLAAALAGLRNQVDAAAAAYKVVKSPDHALLLELLGDFERLALSPRKKDLSWRFRLQSAA